MEKSRKLDIDLPARDTNLKKSRWWAILASLLITILLVLLAGFYGFSEFNKGPHQKLDELVTKKVERREFFETIKATGKMVPLDTWDITANAGGLVENVLVQPGDQVTKNMTLLTLSNQELELKILESELEINRTATEYSKQKSQWRSTILRDEGVLQTLEAKAKEAERAAISDQSFFEQGFISEAQARRSREKAQALMQQLASEKERADIMQDLFEEETIANEKSLKLLKRAHQFLLESAKGLNVKAKGTALVTAVYVNKGQRISVGAPLLELSSGGQLLKVTLEVPEANSRKITRNLEVIITSGNSDLKGRVDRIFPTVTDGYVEVDVLLDGTLPESFRSGRFVEGRIILNKIDNALVIQQPNWISNSGRYDIYKLSNDRTSAVKTSVVIGSSNGYDVLIEEGLSEGDEIIFSNTREWTANQIVLR